MPFEVKAFAVSEEEKHFRAELEKEYQEKIRLIAMRAKGNSNFMFKASICKRLFEWFCSNTRYDFDILKNKRENGSFRAIEYSYKNSVITSNEKYAVVLLGKGGCTAFAEAFKDVCDLLQIDCKVVSGKDKNVILQSFRIAHSWNEVTIDGKRRTVDLDPHYRAYMTAPRTSQTFTIKNKT